MAVTESKGDGYALYNGVKLPNIDTVWTEEVKAQYPYITVCDNTNDMYCYLVYFMTQPLEWINVVDDIYIGHDTSDVKYVQMAYFPDDSAFSAFCELAGMTVEDANANGIYAGKLCVVSEVESKIYLEESQFSAIWTNHDIVYYTGGEPSVGARVYLAASDPIPLDGMNVIEWDGNTEGVESDVSGTHLRIADYQDAENALLTCRAGTMYVAMLDAFETVEKTETEPSGWVLYQGDTVLLAFGEEYATMRPGIWIVADYFGGVESFILAYTPATTEPEEPEEPDTPPIPKVSPHLAFTIGKQLGRRIFR